MAEVLESVAHQRLRVFSREHPLQVWLAPLLSVVVVFLLAKHLRHVLRAKRQESDATESVHVKHYIVFTTFSATPLVRLCIYAGMYIIGLCMVFAF